MENMHRRDVLGMAAAPLAAPLFQGDLIAHETRASVNDMIFPTLNDVAEDLWGVSAKELAGLPMTEAIARVRNSIATQRLTIMKAANRHGIPTDAEGVWSLVRHANLLPYDKSTIKLFQEDATLFGFGLENPFLDEHFTENVMNFRCFQEIVRRCGFTAQLLLEQYATQEERKACVSMDEFDDFMLPISVSDAIDRIFGKKRKELLTSFTESFVQQCVTDLCNPSSALFQTFIASWHESAVVWKIEMISKRARFLEKCQKRDISSEEEETFDADKMFERRTSILSTIAAQIMQPAQRIAAQLSQVQSPQCTPSSLPVDSPPDSGP